MLDRQILSPVVTPHGGKMQNITVNIILHSDKGQRIITHAATALYQSSESLSQPATPANQHDHSTMRDRHLHTAPRRTTPSSAVVGFRQAFTSTPLRQL